MSAIGASRNARDPFTSMLWWSGTMHMGVFALLLIASRLSPQPSPFPEAVAFVQIGFPGPSQGMGGGPSPGEPVEEVAAPEPPKEEAPRVVRPTKEDREQLPMPDAKPKRSKARPKKPESGLIGRDAASRDSARLKAATATPGLGMGGAGGSPFDGDFEYSYYVQQMFGRVFQNWQRVPVRGTSFTIIRFTIMRDGRLQDIQVEESSGVPQLDRAASRAVYLSDPLPPLPQSYPRDRVGVHLRFEYSDQ